MSLAVTQLIGFGVGASFDGYSTEYTTPGTSTISIPPGATTVTIEGIAAGGNGHGSGGGGGGGYAKKNTYAVSGLSGIYISVPAKSSGGDGDPCFAKENSSGGADIMRATGGRLGNVRTGGAGTVGDVLYTGGNGANKSGINAAGGGAAGPSGNGGNASGSTGGTAGGSPAGAGAVGRNGSPFYEGSPYGGGGSVNYNDGSDYTTSGAQGWLKLTWA